jgi:hypothetical protein
VEDKAVECSTIKACIAAGAEDTAEVGAPHISAGRRGERETRTIDRLGPEVPLEDRDQELRDRDRALACVRLRWPERDRTRYLDQLLINRDHGHANVLIGPGHPHPTAEQVHTINEESRELLEAVRDHGGLTPKQAAGVTTVPYELAKKTLRRMAQDGQLAAKNGRYTLLPPVPAVPLSPEQSSSGTKGHEGHALEGMPLPLDEEAADA